MNITYSSPEVLITLKAMMEEPLIQPQLFAEGHQMYLAANGLP